MNWNRAAGRWNDMRGMVHTRWEKLTDEDLERIAGKRAELVGVLQRRYGLARDQVERELHRFERELDLA